MQISRSNRLEILINHQIRSLRIVEKDRFTEIWRIFTFGQNTSQTNRNVFFVIA